MRWVAIIVMVAACKRGSDSSTAPMPSLDMPTDAAAGSAAGPPPPPQKSLGLVFEELDGPPVSAPVGAPVAIKFVPAAVGTKRTRKHTHQALYHTVFANGQPDRWQETQITFVLREEVLAVANKRVTQMRVNVDKAEEIIVADGERNVKTLLDGTYTVDIKGLSPRDIKMSATGRRMGTREEEELSMLLSADAANSTPIHELLLQHALRVGEAVVLSVADQKALLAGGTSPAKITFSLRKLDDGIATYQLDTQLETDGDKRVVRQRYKVRITTGQILEVFDATTTFEKTKYMTSDTKTQTITQFVW